MRLLVAGGDRADAKASVDLPALADSERRDPGTVARAYESAYDALLAVAET